MAGRRGSGWIGRAGGIVWGGGLAIAVGCTSASSENGGRRSPSDDNSPPTLTLETLVFTEEDVAITVDVEVTDVDGDDIDVMLQTLPEFGTVSVAEGNRELTYTPFPDVFGDDAFTLVARDRKTVSQPVTVDVSVIPMDDAPIVEDAAFSVVEDGVLTAEFEARDPDGDVMLFSVVEAPTSGSVSLDPRNGLFTYVPMADFSGQDGFSVVASDARFDSEPATVVVDVQEVNDPPQLFAPSLLVVQEGQRISTPLVIVDPDNDAQFVELVILDGPRHGTASIVGTTLNYASNEGFLGTDVVMLEVDDGTDSATEAVNFLVQ